MTNSAKSKSTTKFGCSKFESTPYPITAVYDYGTVQIKKKRYYDAINIRQIQPCIP